jgi:hypothetical protein
MQSDRKKANKHSTMCLKSAAAGLQYGDVKNQKTPFHIPAKPVVKQ